MSVTSTPPSSQARDEERVRLSVVLEELGKSEEFYERLPLGGASPGYFVQFFENLELESNVPRRLWRTLIDAVLMARRNASVDEIFDACAAVFTDFLKDDAPLTGPLAKLPKLSFLGRVVSREQFKGFLMAHVDGDGKGGSRRSAGAFTNYLRDLDYVSLSGDEELRKLPLGQHVMWATFSEDEFFSNPFATLPAFAPKIRCVLGMPWDDDEQLLFTYKLPGHRTPHVPTVVEAYAGTGGRRVFFRPPRPGATVGRTRARPECIDENTRPEIVHRPVTLEALCAPIKVL